MDLNDFKDACLRTAGDKNTLLIEAYLHGVTEPYKGGSMPSDDILFNWILGLCGESGELADAIKKWRFHNHDLDLSNIQKELGDVMYYWVMLCHYFNLDPNDILTANVEKLKKRYPDGFSSSNSINRVE